MAATPRATASVRTNREPTVVTRHGLRSPDAATFPFRRKSPGTPVAKIKADAQDISRNRSLIRATADEKSHPPSSGRPRRQADFATTTAGQNTKSP
jgi:hypothetical protein